MKHSDFVIGEEFEMGIHRWRCTDIGTRTVCAIILGPVEILTTAAVKLMDRHGIKQDSHLTFEEAEKDGWFNGPPYAVLERVIDEYDMETCEPVSK